MCFNFQNDFLFIKYLAVSPLPEYVKNGQSANMDCKKVILPNSSEYLELKTPLAFHPLTSTLSLVTALILLFLRSLLRLRNAWSVY